MALNPSNNGNLEQLALKGLMVVVVIIMTVYGTCRYMTSTGRGRRPFRWVSCWTWCRTSGASSPYSPSRCRCSKVRRHRRWHGRWCRKPNLDSSIVSCSLTAYATSPSTANRFDVWSFVLSVFTARAYARAVLGVVILSVRPSVCHTRGLWQN